MSSDTNMVNENADQLGGEQPLATRSRMGWARNFTIGVFVVELLCSPFSDAAPNLPGFFLIACSLSLASIISVWCAILNRWFYYVLAIIFLLVDGVLLTFSTGGFDFLLMFLPLAIAIPVSLMLEGIKLFFGRFAIASFEDDGLEEGLQFQTKHLFIAMFVVALICAIFQALYPIVTKMREEGPAGSSELYILSVFTFVISLSALVSIWALMGKRVGIRIPVAILVTAGLITAGFFMLPYIGIVVWIGINSLCFLATSMLLFLLRLDGYRFIQGSKLSL